MVLCAILYLFDGHYLINRLLNIVGTGYLSATENAGWAFATSILRGFVAIIVCAFTLAYLFGMTGVWLTFAAAELITAVVMIIAIRK